MLGRREVFIVILAFLCQSIFAIAQDTTGYVDFDADSLHDAEQASVFLSDGSTLILQNAEIRDYGSEVYTWTGSIQNEPESTVVISVARGVVVGNIQTPNRWWGLSLPREQPVIELDPRSFLSDVTVTPSSIDLIFRDGFEGAVELSNESFSANAIQASEVQTNCVDAENVVDVLVLYTPALAAAGEPEALARLAIEQANDSFKKSKIQPGGLDLRLNLVHLHEVAISDHESTKISVILDSLASGGIENVHELRDQYAADLVVLLTENIGSSVASGAAYWSKYFDPDLAFAAVNRHYLASHTFTHVVGHILRANHDRYAEIKYANNPPLTVEFLSVRWFGFVYLPDWWDCATEPKPPGCIAYRTIMSHPDECDDDELTDYDCITAPIFSSPAISYLDAVAGDDETNNSAELLDNAHIVACHRQNPRLEDIVFADPVVRTRVLEQASENGWERALDITDLYIYPLVAESLGGLEYLKNLRNLDCKGGYIGGTIEDLTPLAPLQHLEWVDASGNQITNIDGLENKLNLREVSLAGNSIIEISPLSTSNIWLGLDLSHNPISSLIPIVHMNELRNLGIEDTEIQDITVISSMRNLEWLDMDRNPIDDIGPLVWLTNLKLLAANDNLYNNISPLLELTQLEQLGAGAAPSEPGALTCEQQLSLVEGLPNTLVWVWDSYDYPDDELGPIDCPGIVCGRYFCGNYACCLD